MDYKELHTGVDENIHWYYQSKQLPLFAYVEKMLTVYPHWEVMDIGAGSGYFSKALLNRLPEAICSATLIDTAYTEKEVGKDAVLSLYRQHTLTPLKEHQLVLMMDVLEHLEDDLAMLLQIRKLNPSAQNRFFITVPAMPSVWSSHDTYLGHYRRYTRQTLTRLLMQAGFQPTRVYYLYGGFFPLVYLKRKLRKAVHDTDLQNHPVWINRMLLQYHTLEMRIARFNTFFGLTCVAEGFIPV